MYNLHKLFNVHIYKEDLRCSQSSVKSIAPNSVGPSDLLCPHLCCLSIIVAVCLSLFILGIVHEVHCVEFGQLS